MGERPLNDRQARFAHEYVIDLNGTQAAIRSGYSKRGADVTACRLLGDPRISRIVQDLKARQLDNAGVSAAWLLERLAGLAEVDVADVFNEVGSLRDLEDMPPNARRLISAIETSRMPGSGNVVTKVKLLDRVRILELIGKHIEVGAFSERLAIQGDELIVSIHDYTGRGERDGRAQANGPEEVSTQGNGSAR